MSLTQTQQQQLSSVVQWMNQVIANSKRTDELDPMPTPIDRDALLRLALAGTSYYLSLEDLVDDIASDLVLGNVPAKFRSVAIDFGASGSTVEKVRLAVNAGDNYPLDQGTLYFFYTNRLVLTNGSGLSTGEPNSPSYAVVSEYFVLTQRIQPDAEGVSSVGTDGTAINTNGLRYFMTIDSRSFAPTEFDLGDIGMDDIWTAVNATGPYSTPNEATILFRAVQDSINKLWLYIGVNEEIGTGHPAVGSSDFRLFPDEDGLDPPPQYQETLPQEASATIPSTVPLNNHEGILYFFGTSGNSSIDDFTTNNRVLNGRAYLYLDTTGRSNFPTIDGGSSVLLSGDPFIVDSKYICEIFYNGSEVMHRFKKVGQVTAGGDMAQSTYDPTGVNGDAFDMDNMVEGSTNKILTVAERAAIAGIGNPTKIIGEWDASSGSFPGGGTAQSGESWIVSVDGTVDGVAFKANDRIIAITDNASTGTFASNWFKADYTDVYQTDEEIETAYNNQVNQVSAGEKTAGTETAVRRFSPKDVADMAGTHGAGGSSDLQTAHTTTLLFDRNRVSTFGSSDNRHTQSGTLVYTYDFTGAVEGSIRTLEIISDGNTITFPSSNTRSIINNSETTLTLNQNVATPESGKNYLLSFLYTNGNVQVYINDLTVLVIDSAAPTFSSGPTSANISTTSFDITATLNENGTVYAVVVADAATAPTSTEVKNGTGSGGSGELASGSELDSGSGATISLSGLSASTDYDVYVVAEDNYGNLQSSPTLVNVSTATPYTFANTKHLLIDASGEGMTVTDNNLLPSDGGGTDQAVSFELWYKTPATMDVARVLFFIEDGGTRVCFIAIAGTGNAAYIRFEDNGTSDYIQTTVDNISLSANTLYHIVGTYSGNGLVSGLTLYVNNGGNNLDATAGTYGSIPTDKTGVVLKLPRTDAAIGLGQYQVFRQFNAELTSGEVTTLYNSGTPVGLNASLQAKCIQENLFEDSLNADNIGTNGVAVGSPTYGTN